MSLLKLATLPIHTTIFCQTPLKIFKVKSKLNKNKTNKLFFILFSMLNQNNYVKILYFNTIPQIDAIKSKHLIASHSPGNNRQIDPIKSQTLRETNKQDNSQTG